MGGLGGSIPLPVSSHSVPTLRTLRVKRHFRTSVPRFANKDLCLSFTAVGILPISFTAVGISLVQYFLGHNMSFTGPSVGSGGRTVRRVFEFVRTYVVRSKGRHQATVVWLHGLGDNGLSWSQLLETLPVPNIKWICPTATQPISVFGCFPSTVRFDVRDLSEDAPDDLEGLDASAALVANLLSTA